MTFFIIFVTKIRFVAASTKCDYDSKQPAFVQNYQQTLISFHVLMLRMVLVSLIGD